MKLLLMLRIACCLLAGGGLNGCATSKPASSPPPMTEVSSILVLPSDAQAMLALETGMGVDDAIQTRNQPRLGGSPIAGAGFSFFKAPTWYEKPVLRRGSKVCM